MNQTIEVLSHEILQLNKSINRYRRIVRELEVENNELKAQVKDLKEQIGDEPFCEQVDKWLHGGAPQECKECTEGKYRELTEELENAYGGIEFLNGLNDALQDEMQRLIFEHFKESEKNKAYRERVKACAEELAACADAMLNCDDVYEE